MEYAIWRACERFGIRPENVKETWDDCDVIMQSRLLGYDQLRCVEEVEQASMRL